MYRIIASSDNYYIKTYQNRKNPNKFIEVKRSNDGHSYMRQYMEWDTDQNKIRNYNGSKSRRGRWFRANRDSISHALADYDEVFTDSDDIDEYV